MPEKTTEQLAQEQLDDRLGGGDASFIDFSKLNGRNQDAVELANQDPDEPEDEEGVSEEAVRMTILLQITDLREKESRSKEEEEELARLENLLEDPEAFQKLFEEMQGAGLSG